MIGVTVKGPRQSQDILDEACGFHSSHVTVWPLMRARLAAFARFEALESRLDRLTGDMPSIVPIRPGLWVTRGNGRHFGAPSLGKAAGLELAWARGRGWGHPFTSGELLKPALSKDSCCFWAVPS